MSKWDPAGFATILREAVASRLHEGVRCMAAESLVQSRLATAREIDEFFRDRDHSVRTLALRGLAASGGATHCLTGLLAFCAPSMRLLARRPEETARRSAHGQVLAYDGKADLSMFVALDDALRHDGILAG